MSQLNDHLAYIVHLYKSGQIEEARYLFGQIQIQYANYPNVLWVKANISSSKDEKIQALQHLLQVKSTGKLADLARKRLNQLLPPAQLPSYPVQPSHYYPSQQPAYLPQKPIYQHPSIAKNAVSNAKTGVLKYRIMLLLAIGLILSTALFPLVRGKFWITETTNMFGSNSRTYYISYNLDLLEFWGAEFYLIPDKYIDIYYDTYSNSNQVMIYDSAFMQMASIGLGIVFFGYALPLGLFLIVPPKIFRGYRGFFAIWVVLHLTLMVVILHESVMSVEGGSLLYFLGCSLLLFLSFTRMPNPTASLAMQNGMNGIALSPPMIAPVIQYPPSSIPYNIADEILRKNGWALLTTSPNGVLYEKHPGVPFFPALFFTVVFALIGTVVVLIWLAMTKKVRCTMAYTQGILTIEKDGQLLFVKSAQDVQQFVTNIIKGRVGYTIVLITGVMSMVVNGILLSQLLA